MCSMPNERTFFVVRVELIIPPFYGYNISQTIVKEVRNVMEVDKGIFTCWLESVEGVSLT